MRDLHLGKLVTLLQIVTAVANLDDHAGLLSMQLGSTDEHESMLLLSNNEVPVELSLQQVHEASAKALAFSHSPTEAAVMLEQVAAAAAAGNVKIDDATEAILNELKSSLTGTTLKAIKAAHDSDQEQLDGHRSAFHSCADDHIKELRKNKDEVEVPVVNSNRSAHSSCRQQSQILSAQQDSACQLLDDWSKQTGTETFEKPDMCKAPAFEFSPPLSPDPETCEVATQLPSSNFRVWLAEKADYFNKKQKEFNEKEEACIAAQNAYSTHDCECDKLQRRFEQGFCEWRVETYATCNELTSCFRAAVSAYVNTVGLVDHNEEMREADWKSVGKLLCFIDVLLAEDDKAEKHTACKSQVVTYPYELTKHDFNGVKAHCDVSSVARHPCGLEFVKEEYAGMADLAECVPCLNVVEKTGTFAAVQVPRPPTTPTCTEAAADAVTVEEDAAWACVGKPNGRHLLWLPDGLAPFWAHCADGWVVIQQRADGDTDFQRSWVEYADGFGEEQEFWIGNHQLHRLTASGGRLRILMETGGAEVGVAEYGTFRVGNEQSDFTLEVSGYCDGSNLGDSMEYHNGRPFSTVDNDNDEHGASCARDYGGGWWFGSCYNANLNLPYDNGLSGSYSGWYHNPWSRDSGTFKRTFMLLKPSSITSNPSITIAGNKYFQFWWWSPNSVWPEGATDVFGAKYLECSNESPVCLSKLPAELEEKGAELLAVDEHDNQFLWRFDPNNNVAHAAWQAMHDGQTVTKVAGSAWNPKIIKESDLHRISPQAQVVFMYTEINGIKTLLLDDDGCDCHSTLSMGMPSCKQKYSLQHTDGKEGDVGVDDLSDDGCSAPSQHHSLRLFFRMDPVTTGLIAHYPMEGDCGAGSVAGVQALIGVKGVRGQAVSFQGGFCLDDSFRNHDWGEHMSVCAWARRTGSPGSYQGIVSTGYYHQGSWELRVGREGCGTGTCNMLGGGVITEANSEAWDVNGVSMTMNKWHHICMIYDGSTVSYYVDKQLAGTNGRDSGRIISKDMPVFIGTAQGFQERFYGDIDEVRIYKKVLTDHDVEAIFSSDTADQD